VEPEPEPQGAGTFGRSRSYDTGYDSSTSGGGGGGGRDMQCFSVCSGLGSTSVIVAQVRRGSVKRFKIHGMVE
jgi:hypothetical protein